eukprot:2346984-Amphidinium_carterae.1
MKLSRAQTNTNPAKHPTQRRASRIGHPIPSRHSATRQGFLPTQKARERERERDHEGKLPSTTKAWQLQATPLSATSVRNINIKPAVSSPFSSKSYAWIPMSKMARRTMR